VANAARRNTRSLGDSGSASYTQESDSLMALLSLKNVSIRFGGEPLLDEVSLHVERGERACLVGRNGAGKSTLLKILAGDVEPDSGEVLRTGGIRVAYLPQEVPSDLSGTVRSIVESGVPSHADLDHWEHADAAEQAISKLNLNPEMDFSTLSGGIKRRTLLARALVCEPDVLLLDEPTNHLDIASIEWLEGFLRRQVPTFLFVTHDRTFVRHMATTIIDLDRGSLAGWDCDYDTFLRRKQQLLDDEAAEWQKKGKRLTQEEAWIRQGIKARRTRDEGRVRALKALRAEFRERRTAESTSRIKLQSAGRSGAQVIKARDVTFAYPGEPPIIRSFDARIMRGERVGIIGPNGSGKTTLLRLLCGELTPVSGSVTLGTQLQIAYFDQLRDTLDDQKTIAENVAGENELVDVGGQRRHVYSYLQDFLFTPARARSPVHVLSGGERNRLLIAKLFLEPCNFLIMDEPTNDLDAETLELLEEQLQQNAATLVLVSHDRAFLNNVVTSTLVLEGDGHVRQYAGGYDDWLEQRPAAPAPAKNPQAEREAVVKPRTQKLTYKETRELEGIGPQIEALEAEQAEIVAAHSDPGFYKRPAAEIAADHARAEAIALELDTLIERWAELEARA
jgi:ATP-binding cassette subfamily F protein uup